MVILFLWLFKILVPVVSTLCPDSRYLSGGLPGETPPVATASTQSRERLNAVKQALRALGFNKQVFIVCIHLLLGLFIQRLLTAGII